MNADDWMELDRTLRESVRWIEELELNLSAGPGAGLLKTVGERLRELERPAWEA
ncbi:MAG TPA: hypothetical protein VEN81_11280 [Planctomycetota bacterium]|nr:hypothetical protein [Planctomycetota bacterium]